MPTGVIITGTDTDIGKTVFAAGLTAALNGVYFKPIQAGTTPTTDRDEVIHLTGAKTADEIYTLSLPASPHLSAEHDSITIEPDSLKLPITDQPLIVEGAGGLVVPITRNLLQIDLFARWQLPLILCARTSLGTINHTLLSVEAIHKRNLPLMGIAFIGENNSDNIRTITDFACVPCLGRLPRLDPLNREALKRAFASHIDLTAIREAIS